MTSRPDIDATDAVIAFIRKSSTGPCRCADAPETCWHCLGKAKIEAVCALLAYVEELEEDYMDHESLKARYVSLCTSFGEQRATLNKAMEVRDADIDQLRARIKELEIEARAWKGECLEALAGTEATSVGGLVGHLNARIKELEGERDEAREGWDRVNRKRSLLLDERQAELKELVAARARIKELEGDRDKLRRLVADAKTRADAGDPKGG